MTGARERRCIVTGEILPEARHLRFVLSPDGEIVPDVEAKLPGRGIWVGAGRAAITDAIAKRLFARAARHRSRSRQRSGRPRRGAAGRAHARASGAGAPRGRIAARLRSDRNGLAGGEPPPVIIEAADAAADGRRKLQAAATVARVMCPLSSGRSTNAELSLALGRANVVHAALKSGRIAERLIFEAARLNGFRPLKSGVWEGFSGG